MYPQQLEFFFNNARFTYIEHFNTYYSKIIYSRKKRKEVKLSRTAQPYEIFTFREMNFRSSHTGTSRIFAAIFRIAI